MILTERDRKLIALLQSYGCLTTSQIESLVFTGIATTTVLRRLRKLSREGFIKKPLQLPESKIPWTPTLRGSRAVGNLPIRKHLRIDTLAHDLKVVEVRLKLEEFGIANSWTSDHEIRSSIASECGVDELKYRSLPDGLFTADIGGIKQTIALELELNFKNEGRYTKTFWRYQRRCDIWGVWYVVKSEAMGNSISDIWFRSLSKLLETNVCLMWSVFDDVMANPLEAKYFLKAQSGKLVDLFLPAQSTALAQSSADLSQLNSAAFLTTKDSKKNPAPSN